MPRPVSAKWVGLLLERWLVALVNDCQVPAMQDNIPAEDLKVGTTIQVRGRQGEDLDLRVHEIKKETVVLDLNHPLAGKTLNFGIKVLDIQPGESSNGER